MVAALSALVCLGSPLAAGYLHSASQLGSYIIHRSCIKCGVQTGNVMQESRRGVTFDIVRECGRRLFSEIAIPSSILTGLADEILGHGPTTRAYFPRFLTCLVHVLSRWKIYRLPLEVCQFPGLVLQWEPPPGWPRVFVQSLNRCDSPPQPVTPSKSGQCTLPPPSCGCHWE